jgi:hypothetical protein
VGNSERRLLTPGRACMDILPFAGILVSAMGLLYMFF